MRLYPAFDDFAKTYDKGKPQAVWTRLIADLETPVSAMLKIGADRPMSFLLESVEGGAVRGRYSVIGFEPDIVWRASGDQAEINRAPVKSPDKFTRCKGGTLAALRDLLAESRMELPASLPPMALGV
ncbi:MAG: anthranilate synthase component I, partial [Rhodomicrobium sp.]|nr:anthranilate synthase component I [Rhodomicrobium sp.]